MKTAFFASDPNLGRILAAIGYAGIADLDVAQSICISTTCLVAQARRAAHPGYTRSRWPARHARRARSPCVWCSTAEREQATVWTCDLSHDYVTINAEYRT